MMKCPIVLLTGVMLILSTVACSVFSSPEALNDGQGTREDPVAVRVYARTIDYDVRALSVVWVEPSDAETDDDPTEQSLRVQLQVRCSKPDDKICILEDIGEHVKLVDGSGILYNPSFRTENPLEGEILGDAEKAGWVLYRIPHGIKIAALVAEYGQDQRVFFELP